ncbi:general stress protein [Arthrobacter russicus]|uniref:General stress protein 17M-like domain-containing protein n=1 Tax=Arthrobacter russicus TaxID=172040 RepID=A0ABU1J8P0_9MICC|nr:general stress protein [Arthrobacter russicus]MDR6268738.1 hypothetical protein [Arthrobacter russicus]
MSNLFGSARALADPRSVPEGDTVGSYTSYLDAQKAVDYLADQQFPVQKVSIVGNDLKMVERVTGRLSYPKVALNGALTGLWFGLFVGVLLSFFNSTSGGSLLSIPIAMLLGAAFWMLFGIVTYAAQRGKRDFTSTSQVLASSYDVIVAREASMEAQRLLQNLPMAKAGVPAQTPPYQANPQYRPGTDRDSRPVQGGPVQGGQPGVAPQRPEGWTDPYGSGGQGAGTPSAGQQAQPTPETAPAPVVRGAEGGTAPGKFPDLPDGRPQYGVRIDPEPKPAEAEAAAEPKNPEPKNAPGGMAQ